MRYTLHLLFSIALLVSCGTLAAQSTPQKEEAQKYLDDHATEIGLLATDYTDLQVTDAYVDQKTGIRHLYVQQYHEGIEIEGAIAGLHTDKAGIPFHFTSRFVPKLNKRITTTAKRYDADQAILAANSALKQPMNPETTAVTPRLVYQEDEKGYLRLSWRVEIYTADQQHYYVARIDAESGKLLSVDDLVINCEFDHAASATGDCDHAHGTHKTHNANSVSGKTVIKSTTSTGNYYRVFDLPVESPTHGDRSLVVTNGDAIASPYGWHNDGTLSYPVTRGNNVYAYYDGSGGNAGEPAVGGLNPLQPLNFDFPLDLTQQPETYKNAAITNLFYWNNKIHDLFYHFGFNEAAGNFQQDNVNRGGIGQDGVMAEAQDGGGTNNANFLTLPDGVPGRMQMYLWSSASAAELVHINTSANFPDGGPGFSSLQAAFGGEINESGLSGDLVIVAANALSASECSSCGCGTGQGVGLPPSNDVTGKIVLIDRGDCAFIEKVMGAQAGGASGVIVVNNQPGEDPISMGGDETGNTIVIPAAMISLEDGAVLKQELAAGAVNVDLRRDEPLNPMKDGDFDNGIIAHEYGHGISTRLTGGPSQTCLSGDEQAGEGWSDFFALFLTTDLTAEADAGESGRGIGTYVFDQPIDGNGIRPARYSRDLAVNPYTYGDLNNAEITVPHGIGFIFCTALHDMAWNLIDEYGYNPDLTNGTIADGNILAIQLVIDGLKLQPCSPTFIDSRDAILAADVALTGGANSCLIWEAFAKRGMGASAIPGTNTRGDETPAFDLPTSCAPMVTIEKSVNKNTVTNGDELTYTLTVTNGGDAIAQNVMVTDPLPIGLTYVSGSATPTASLDQSSNTVHFSQFTLHPGEQKVLTFRATVDMPTATEVVFFDDMEDGINAWTPNISLNQWQHIAGAGTDSSFGWSATDPDNASNQTLELSNPVSLTTGAELRFSHTFNSEAGFDGGIVELSNDNGLTWYDLGNQMTQGGYTSFVPFANNPLINGFAFAGSSNGWMQTKVNLSLFAGQEVIIRFRFSSDALTGGQGWTVDDVVIGTTITDVINTAEYTATGNLNGESTVASLVINTGTAKLGGSNLKKQATGTQLKTSIYPNPAGNLATITIEDLQAGSVTIELIDVNGKIVNRTSRFTESSSLSTSMNVNQLPRGLYSVRISNARRIQTLRLTLQ